MFQFYKDKAGEWRWRLRANNHEIIATSGEGYKNKQDCLHAIDLVRSLSQDAEIRIYKSDKEYIVYSKEENTSLDVTDEVVESMENPVTRPLEREKPRSRRWLWAIPAILLMLILIFLFRSTDNGTDVLQDNTELAQQFQEEQAAIPSKTADPEIMEGMPVATNGIPAGNHMIEPGDNLWRLAEKYYKDGHMWPLIFKANMSKISHPDILSPGITLDIPNLDGSLANYTEADSNKIAVAFIDAYLAYKSHDHPEARDYLLVANWYDSDAVFEVESKVDASDLLYAKK
jgi:uncharacterized protein YegP (UPF0339 family)